MIADLTYLRGGIDWHALDPDAKNEAQAAWIAMREWDDIRHQRMMSDLLKAVGRG